MESVKLDNRSITPETLKKLQIDSDRLNVDQNAIESSKIAETIMKSKTTKKSSIPSKKSTTSLKKSIILSPNSVVIPSEVKIGVSPDTGSEDLEEVNIDSSPDPASTNKQANIGFSTDISDGLDVKDTRSCPGIAKIISLPGSGTGSLDENFPAKAHKESGLSSNNTDLGMENVESSPDTININNGRFKESKVGFSSDTDLDMYNFESSPDTISINFERMVGSSPDSRPDEANIEACPDNPRISKAGFSSYTGPDMEKVESLRENTKIKTEDQIGMLPSEDFGMVTITTSHDHLKRNIEAQFIPGSKQVSSLSSDSTASANSDGFIELNNEFETRNDNHFNLSSSLPACGSPIKSSLPTPRKTKKILNFPEPQEDVTAETERLMSQLQLQQQIRTLTQKNEDLLVAQNQSLKELTFLKKSNEEKTKENNCLNELIMNSQQRDSNRSTYLHISSKLELTKAENQHLLLEIQNLTSEKVTLERQIVDLKSEVVKTQDLLELSILDKCVAEESLELLKDDLKVAKDRIEELALELDLNEPKKVQEEGKNQLQLQNERLKEALYLLRELSIKAESELKGRLESKEAELKNLEGIREDCLIYEKNLLDSNQQIEYLKSQLEDMNDSTDIITHLSTSNHNLNATLTQKEKECLELKGLKEINDELDSVHIEIQKRLYKELDLKSAIIEELKFRFESLQRELIVHKQKGFLVDNSKSQQNELAVSHEECKENYRILNLKYIDCLAEFKSLELFFQKTEFDKNVLKKYLADVEEDIAVIECVSGLKYIQYKSRLLVHNFVEKIGNSDGSNFNSDFNLSLIVSLVGSMNFAGQNLLLLESMSDSKAFEYFLSLSNNVQLITKILDELKNGDLEYAKLELERLNIKTDFKVDYDYFFSEQLLWSIQVLIKCVNTELKFMFIEMDLPETKSSLDQSGLNQIEMIDRLIEYFWINKAC